MKRGRDAKKRLMLTLIYCCRNNRRRQLSGSSMISNFGGATSNNNSQGSESPLPSPRFNRYIRTPQASSDSNSGGASDNGSRPSSGTSPSAYSPRIGKICSQPPSVHIGNYFANWWDIFNRHVPNFRFAWFGGHHSRLTFHGSLEEPIKHNKEQFLGIAAVPSQKTSNRRRYRCSCFRVSKLGKKLDLQYC